MSRHAVGVSNGNFRGAAELRRLGQEIRREALNPTSIHPREKKLARLMSYMGVDEYNRWYDLNRYTSPIARWEKVIDSKLAEFTDEMQVDDQIETLTARAKTIGEGLAVTGLPAEAYTDLEEELVLIGHEFQKLGLTLPDDRADCNRAALCGVSV